MIFASVPGPHQDRNPWDPKTALAGYHPPSTVCSRPDKNLDVVVADTPEPVSQPLGEIDGNPRNGGPVAGKIIYKWKYHPSN